MLLVLAQCLWLSLPVVLAWLLHLVVVKQALLATLKKPVTSGRPSGGAGVLAAAPPCRGAGGV